MKQRYNLVWLENLNLRGGYKAGILDYIAEKYLELLPLYQSIYQNNDRSYWAQLDEEMQKITTSEGLFYLRDDDSITAGRSKLLFPQGNETV